LPGFAKQPSILEGNAMITLLTRYLHFILISLLLALFVLAWLFPGAGTLVGTAFVLLSFSIVSVAIVRKQRDSYSRGRISRGMFLRNVVLEITGTGLTMVAAGLLGRTLAGMLTAQVNDDLVRFAAGMGIGLLAGILVGLFVSQTWGRLVRNSLQ
jgi:hypothetical protein